MNKTKLELISSVHQRYARFYDVIEEISLYNQNKVLKVFQEEKVDSRHFYGSSGYGYGDVGRYKLESVYSKVFGSEAALVRTQFGSATHAIVTALRGLLKPNDTILSITGHPYDTVHSAIIGDGTGQGSALCDYGVVYDHIDLLDNEEMIDYDTLIMKLKTIQPKMVFLQKSRGYMWRNALSISQIEKIVKVVREHSKDSIIFVDNCYGEFVEKREPCDVGVDVAVGSLIKNPGGSIAPTGAYIVGTKKCIDTISGFFYSDSIKDEIGSYESGYRLLFQGLFMAPHIVAQSLKTALLFSAAYQDMGYKVMPTPDAARYDITQSIHLHSREELLRFCKGIQQTSPVESYLTPEPWDMPGYTSEVIMAAGTFVQGASIELSADAPMEEPYIVYLQGGITYEHGQLSLLSTLPDTSE